MFQTKVVEEIKTHILFSVTFFSLENRAVYEIRWKNIESRMGPQMRIWRMHIACWIAKATHTNTHTHTHTESVILIAFNGNNGCKYAPQRYLIRTLPLLFAL